MVATVVWFAAAWSGSRLRCRRWSSQETAGWRARPEPMAPSARRARHSHSPGASRIASA